MPALSVGKPLQYQGSAFADDVRHHLLRAGFHGQLGVGSHEGSVQPVLTSLGYRVCAVGRRASSKRAPKDCGLHASAPLNTC